MSDSGDPEVEAFEASRVRRPLAEIERAIIALAISSMREGQDEARAQLAVATYGGLAHPGSHVCFMIDVPDGVPPIPQGYDVIDLDVDSPVNDPLDIQVFVKNGRLDSVDLTTYASDESGSTWPSLERIRSPRAT